MTLSPSPQKDLLAALRTISKTDPSGDLAALGSRLHVTFLLDKSGSMNGLKRETIRAFNDYLDELRPNPDVICSLHQFPDEDGYGRGVITTYEDQPSALAPALTDENFRPCGGTPLFLSITNILTRLYRKAPLARHVVVILTDGADTSGGEAPARELIRMRRAEGWQILFLGANIDIAHMASLLGIDPKQSLSYNARNYSSETFRALAGSINKFAKEEANEEIDLTSLPKWTGDQR